VNLEERKLKEIEHSDRRRSIVRGHEYSTDAIPGRQTEAKVEDAAAYERHFSNMKFYSISGASFALRDALLYRDIGGKVALDYCCGNGEIAIEIAKRGAAKVHGIDISPVAIENARALAKAGGVEELPLNGRVCFPAAVHGVAHKRVAERCEVHPDLVRAAGLRSHFH